jgi:putative nucleotidyltransferase with HDIG domain
MKKTHLDIIDPIHDFVRVNQSELEIIDTPIFQRLRRIKQLSGAHLIYPGAQHTRFEHSLGVMHIASMACQSLLGKSLIPLDQIQNLRFAGLLHDIGHGPFSHLFEEILQKNQKISHEDIGREIIQKTEIGDLISRNGFNKKSIADIAFGYSKHQFVNEVISGVLSADIMDYLLRDGYFTGAEHAKIDHKRLTYSLDVYKNKLALDKSALVNFETMLISRYQMFKAVYFHKTVRAGEVMLLEAMRLAEDELGLSSLDLDDFLKLSDESVITKLLNLSEHNFQLKTSKKIATDYLNRNLFKCVFERTTSSTHNLSTKITEELKESIAKKSKTAPNEIHFDTSTTHSIPMTPTNKESKSVFLITKEPKVKAEEFLISDIPLVSTMSGKMNILRVYTQQDNRKKVEIAAKSILNDLKL